LNSVLRQPTSAVSRCSIPWRSRSFTSWTSQGRPQFVLFVPGEDDRDRIGRAFYGAFACDDVEATHRQLSARGVEFTTPPTSAPWGSFAAFKDPDGNQFVLSSR